MPSSGADVRGGCRVIQVVLEVLPQRAGQLGSILGERIDVPLDLGDLDRLKPGGAIERIVHLAGVLTVDLVLGFSPLNRVVPFEFGRRRYQAVQGARRPGVVLDLLVDLRDQAAGVLTVNLVLGFSPLNRVVPLEFGRRRFQAAQGGRRPGGSSRSSGRSPSSGD